MIRIKRLGDVRSEILSGRTFDISFCTYDEARKKGGERESYTGCKVVSNKAAKVKGEAMAGGTIPPSNSRNPQHYVNGTFNVQLIINDVPVIRKIHWLLIEEFNGFQVVL